MRTWVLTRQSDFGSDVSCISVALRGSALGIAVDYDYYGGIIFIYFDIKHDQSTAKKKEEEINEGGLNFLFFFTPIVILQFLNKLAVDFFW